MPRGRQKHSNFLSRFFRYLEIVPLWRLLLQKVIFLEPHLHVIFVYVAVQFLWNLQGSYSL